MPNDLLELSLEQVNAVVAGYSDRLIDNEITAVMTGYYTGHYSNARHPKSPATFVKKIYDSHKKAENKRSKKHKNVDAPNVELFQRLEAIRLSQVR